MEVNSKTVEKLIDTVAEGVGVLANHWLELDAKKIKRIGEAEAEVEKQKIIKQAEATETAMEVFARAEKRFLLEQYSKQINLENIIVMARDSLGDAEVSDKPVDPDWSRRFVSIAQDVSREEMQQMLADILAGEVKQPETFSLRTLDFVKNIGSNDLTLFTKIVPFSTNDGYMHISKSNANNGFSDVTYGELMELMELGFIKPSLTTVRTLSNAEPGKNFLVNMKVGAMVFEFLEAVEKMEFPVIQLTKTATELVPLIDIKSVPVVSTNKYAAELEEYYLSKKMRRVKLK